MTERKTSNQQLAELLSGRTIIIHFRDSSLMAHLQVNKYGLGCIISPVLEKKEMNKEEFARRVVELGGLEGMLSFVLEQLDMNLEMFMENGSSFSITEGVQGQCKIDLILVPKNEREQIFGEKSR